MSISTEPSKETFAIVIGVVNLFAVFAIIFDVSEIPYPASVVGTLTKLVKSIVENSVKTSIFCCDIAPSETSPDPINNFLASTAWHGSDIPNCIF